MDRLPGYLCAEVCLYLDVTALLQFEFTHKTLWTKRAWRQVLRSRFQLSLVNRPQSEEHPLRLIQTLVKCVPSPFFHTKTEELLEQTTAWCASMQTYANVSDALARFIHNTPTREGHALLKGNYAVQWQWLRTRELAQRGIVKNAAMLLELKPGMVIVHLVALKHGKSRGLSQISSDLDHLKCQTSKIQSVRDGLVKFKRVVGIDGKGRSQLHGEAVWVPRCDMMVLGSV